MGIYLLKVVPPDINRKVITQELEIQIRHISSAELTETNSATIGNDSENQIRHIPCAEFKGVPIELLVNKLPYSHLKVISKIEDFVKRTFYELESIRGSWLNLLNELFYFQSKLHSLKLNYPDCRI